MIQNNIKVIGVTGLSGSGKSSISNILKNHAHIIDADEISKRVLKYNTDAYTEVVDYFGDDILLPNKDIDRKKLGTIIFSDKQKHSTLTKITHKYIIKIIIDNVLELKNINNKHIIIDVPVLIGNELEKIVDEIWVVYADEEVLIDRIMKRDNISKENAKNRLDKQMPQEELKKYADVLIENNIKNMQQLEEEVLKLI